MSMLPMLLALALAAGAASPGDGVRTRGDSSNLLIVGSSYGRVVNRTVVDPYGSSARDRYGRPRARMRGAPPPIILLQREAYLLVRNDGDRKVESVEWSVIFYSDAKRENVVERHAFRSKETIRSGEMKFLSETVKEAAPTAFESYSIDRVDFADGTSTGP